MNKILLTLPKSILSERSVEENRKIERTVKQDSEKVEKIFDDKIESNIDKNEKLLEIDDDKEQAKRNRRRIRKEREDEGDKHVL